MKCSWIEKIILKQTIKIINKHKTSEDPSELAPFVLDLMDLSLAFDKFVQHLASLIEKEEKPDFVFPVAEQKYKS